MEVQLLSGGFADAPVEGARVFRAVMQAMARPGRIERLEGARPPAPMSVAAGGVALTLCGPDTPVHLAGALDCAELRGWLAFHTGAPVVGREAAVFAFGTWEALLPLSGYAIGTPDYPDRSATLVVEMDRLEAAGMRLTGPGIAGMSALSLPEVTAFRANAARFPLGLDFLFCCGDRLAGLPRTTRVEAG
ncbi:phosphonate C-P lyase system protein PhnH [Roseovarius autotrophicus]|uniref:phosphonate C-P lyase system protein PhnH n=1 Tax=Roseovarius autotrophicus TaxID=2824121 RepID=UPI001A0CE642|nr:phosphonate C-P lyase system protein PhnH [Roseovarius autotrophicus]MBE0453657.1 phosphonate C-P lyase system protein PhnH [Roseovarius sp.]